MTGEAHNTRTIASTLNIAFALMVGGAAMFLLFGAPLSPGHGRDGNSWLLLPCVLAIVPHWALIHEAIHGHFHAQRSVNDVAGRVLGILFLAPYDGLRFGHLSHHALNARPTERPEIYDPQQRSRLRAITVFYLRLLGGLYLAELLSGPLSLLPRRIVRPLVRRIFYAGTPDAAHMADRAEQMLLAPRILRRMRFDALVILLLISAAFATHVEPRSSDLGNSRQL